MEEALQAGRPLDRIVIALGRHGTRMEEIVRRARERGVPVRFEDRGQLDRLAMSRDHQGVIALAAMNDGISSTQPPQSVAQKLSRTTFPR